MKTIPSGRRDIPLALDRLLDLLDDVEDPRCCGKVEHRLTDILVIAVCAVIACRARKAGTTSRCMAAISCLG
ncbi:MAG: transposase family protein [Janthinobacterium lividum]